MKIRLRLETLNALDRAIQLAIEDIVLENNNPDSDEQNDMLETLRQKAEEVSKQWVCAGEYVSIEIDTEANTATVLPNNNGF